MARRRSINGINLLLIVIVLIAFILLIAVAIIYSGVLSGKNAVVATTPIVDSFVSTGDQALDLVDTYVPALAELNREYYQKVCLPNFTTETPGEEPACYVVPGNPSVVDRCPVGCADAEAIISTCRDPELADNSICALFREEGLIRGGEKC